MGGVGTTMMLRRITFALLVALTALAALAGLTHILAADGLILLDYVMLACFGLTLPWTLIGFWNAIIGFVLLRWHVDALAATDLKAKAAPLPIRGRTAILMCVHNEDPDRVFKHLGQISADLARTGIIDKFDIHLLSDTTDASIADQERGRFALWQQQSNHPDRLFYRRRVDNTDHKNGNLWEFLDSHEGRYDYFMLLDADSLMSAERIGQMVQRMDNDATLGIYQALIVGLPNASPFARIFQFGMRQGMRSYTTGAIWWQGGAGPCWGHNVIIRMQPFIDHCALPRLAGSPPLGGLVLSHDQVEAAMMRGAGYDVRVLVEETGSYEENPPTLADFIARDLRWCQGNMQYFGLLNMAGINAMGRLQLFLAILMYTAAPAWLGFMMVGLAQAVFGGAIMGDGAGWQPATQGFAIGLFVMMMTFNFTPKIMGLVDVLCRAETRAAYGGTAKLLLAGALEFVFGVFLAPVIAVAQTVFIAGLLRGKTIRWNTQQRSQYELSMADAMKGLWPQTLLGAVIFTTLYLAAPAVLPWAAPIFIPLLLAAPFAALTTRRSLGNWMMRRGICATPEELDRPQIMTIRPTSLPKPLLGGKSAELVA